MIVAIVFSTLKDSDCLDRPSLESHKSLHNDDLFYDLEYRLYEAMRPIFIPLQFLCQVITLPVTAEALWRMGYDSEMATTICSTFWRIFGILLMMSRPKSIIEFVKLGIDDTNLSLTEKRGGKPYELEARGKGKVHIDSWKAEQYEDFGNRQYAFLTPFFARPQGKICHFRLDSERIEHCGKHRGPCVKDKIPPTKLRFRRFPSKDCVAALLSPAHNSQQFR